MSDKKPTGTLASGVFGRLIKENSTGEKKLNDAASVKSGSESQSVMSSQKGGFRALMMMKKKMNKWKITRGQSFTTGGSTIQDRQVKLANTYHIEPADSTRFNVMRVQEVIRDVISFYFIKMEKYQAAKCAQMSRFISEEIKGKVKELGFKRYKIACQVFIGQKCEQDIHMASMSVWNPEDDNMASYVFYKNDIYVIGLVFGTYFE